MSAKKKSTAKPSPSLDAALSIHPHYPLQESFKILRVSNGVGYQLLNDGLLQSFMIGARRFCTVAHIQECADKLAKRGANAPKPKERLAASRRGKKAAAVRHAA